MLEDLIYQLIIDNIKCIHLDVSGDGQHFEAVVVSDVFIAQNRIARHKIIYQALGDKMGTEIHALSMKLYTAAEWEARG